MAVVPTRLYPPRSTYPLRPCARPAFSSTSTLLIRVSSLASGTVAVVLRTGTPATFHPIFISFSRPSAPVTGNSEPSSSPLLGDQISSPRVPSASSSSAPGTMPVIQSVISSQLENPAGYCNPDTSALLFSWAAAPGPSGGRSAGRGGAAHPAAI